MAVYPVRIAGRGDGLLHAGEADHLRKIDRCRRRQWPASRFMAIGGKVGWGGANCLGFCRVLWFGEAVAVLDEPGNTDPLGE
jgi:hypothetical protein